MSFFLPRYIPWRPNRWASIHHLWNSSHNNCIARATYYPLQCSCLENPRDGGPSWAAVCGVAQSQTRLRWLSSSFKYAIKVLARGKESTESEKRKGPMTTGKVKEEEPAEQPEEQPGSRRSRRVNVIKTTWRVFHTGNGPLSQVHIYSFNNSEHLLYSRHSAGDTMDKLLEFII